MTIININKLHHKAKSGYDVDLKAEFVQDESDEDRVFLIDNFTKAKIGYIDFQIIPPKNTVFINDMENYLREGKTKNPYKGIGNLLHEYVIFTLAQNEVENCTIQLSVSYNSHVFHFLEGFRFNEPDKNEAMQALIDSRKKITKEDLKNFPTSMVMPAETVMEKIKGYQEEKIEKRLGF